MSPDRVWNRPGLPAVARRVGTHGEFKAEMLRRLSAVLPELSTREADDFTIALLDAFATAADVLTFYQERIANEAYLRTATERLSVLQLARLLGYELRPGLAASTFVRFNVLDAPLASGRALVPAGTRIQSVPPPGETPEVFETIEPLEARAELNAMRPRLRQPRPIRRSSASITVRGADTNLRAGDRLLLVEDAGNGLLAVRRIHRVVADAAAQTTRLDLVDSPPPPPPLPRPKLERGRPTVDARALTTAHLDTEVIGRVWSNEDLAAQALIQRWSPAAVESAIVKRKLEGGPAVGQVYAFRQRSAIFGHQAPRWDTIPPTLRYGERVLDSEGKDVVVKPAYQDTWEGRTLAADAAKSGGVGATVYLDTVYPSIVAGSWVVLSGPTVDAVHVVEATREVSRSDYLLNAKVTSLSLDSASDLDRLTIRDTTVLAHSEQLEVVDQQIVDDVSGTTLVLDRAYLNLRVGQHVVVAGELAQLAGVIAAETVELAQVLVEDGLSVLIFRQPLVNRYVRGTVTCNGNVARATHGETRAEVLGSGDGSARFQRFALRQPPLTWTTAPTASGAHSSLEVRVDGVRWHETPTLEDRGPADQVYVTRTDDDGVTSVQFGDGRIGARLPSGQENVRATYRRGIGASGLVDAGTLTMLLDRPAGISDVDNPQAAAGAADPESRDHARANAPLGVLAMGRIVSLQDYEDFARAFAGIAKARAAAFRENGQPGVFLTVGGQSGAAVTPGSVVHSNLLIALGRASGTTRVVRLDSYRQALFRVAARVKVHDDFIATDVLAAVGQRLRQVFSFEARDFGQPVTLSEVAATIQVVRGVVAVDIDALYRIEDPPTLSMRLAADMPALRPAEVLMLDPGPIALERMP